MSAPPGLPSAVAHLGHNVRIALEALRASTLRSALTILGVVIGVSTVMTMASIVAGIRTQIVNAVEVAGPTTFYVMKYWATTPVNPDNLPAEVRSRPDLDGDEARRIAALPEIAYAGIWAQILGRVEYEGARSQPTTVFGADRHFTEIQGGELVEGRWFSESEERAGAPVIVLGEDVARRVFGRVGAVGKTVRIGGRPAEVIGLYRMPENIFAPPGAETGAIGTFRWVDRQFFVEPTQQMFYCVKPRPGVTVAQAQEAVTVELRSMRGLRPGERSSFDLITSSQILDTFNSLTGAFFLVMIILSSVALLVGGIGVMAIMMVSVTDRTREIGVRKALGATRRDIRQQFLVEAATLTGLGGVIGILVGLLAGRVVNLALGITSTPPVGITAVAVVVSIAIGVVFGLLPAQRAARMDPVEALRYE